jgi:hypothetical protein
MFQGRIQKKAQLNISVYVKKTNAIVSAHLT